MLLLSPQKSCSYKTSAFIIICALQLFTYTRAKIISDCSTITSATAEYIPNPNTTCNSRYPFIYCNAELSAYCTQDECIDEFECEREEELSAASDSEDQVTSTSTMKMTTISTHPGTRRTTAKVKTTTLEPTKPTAVAITATTKTIATIPIISTQATKTITTTTTTGNPTIEPNINPTTIEALNIRQLCRIGITENYPYMRNCRYYYRCTNGYLLFQECPYLMSFDVYNGYCKHAREARCVNQARNIIVRLQNKRKNNNNNNNQNNNNLNNINGQWDLINF